MQTIFIVAAVSIGVAVIVFMSAMLSSLQANFIKRVLTSQPHIQLIPPDEVARPQRSHGPGWSLRPTVQRPAQRIRSIDQWQKIRTCCRTWPEITNVSPTMRRRRSQCAASQPLGHADRHRSRGLFQDRHGFRTTSLRASRGS